MTRSGGQAFQTRLHDTPDSARCAPLLMRRVSRRVHRSLAPPSNSMNQTKGAPILLADLRERTESLVTWQGGWARSMFESNEAAQRTSPSARGLLRSRTAVGSAILEAARVT